ncbi:MAG: twin-arginine translocation signal domain-containing protein [Nitrospirae bacterium]|nr:MAG: twin-arginine translocation signal domain-containing protein [Nitrospirota bacterium]
MQDESLFSDLSKRGISRRDFLTFCSTMAATLGLQSTVVPQIAEALEKKQKPYVVWLEFQDCAGDSESILRSTKPTIAQLVLDVISLEYHETIMAPSGKNAEKSLADVVKNHKGKYIAIVEGSIPMKDGGVYCCIGGKTAIDMAKEVCGNALATIAVGSCASYGGIPAAAPNPTGAVSVKQAVPNATVINLPGCPVNCENLTATVVHYLTFGALPQCDKEGRPLFAYGKRIHDNCERRPHFDAGQFVRKWGDDGHRKGWCLYEMGCKGPQSYMNCPTIRWNEGTSWPVMAGHGCFGCGQPQNWDALGSIYSRLPNVPGAGYQTTADKIGLGVAAAAAAGVAVHAAVRASKCKAEEDKK